MAKEKSDNAEVEENEKLTDYENKIGEYISGNREETLVNAPTGIKTATYIKNLSTVATAYTSLTSMNGLTRQTDAENKISEYLSYSDEKGYEVLKSGWYYIDMLTELGSSTQPMDLALHFYINNVAISRSRSWCTYSAPTPFIDRNDNSFSIYLSEGDYIYFKAISNYDANVKRVQAVCYPMF